MMRRIKLKPGIDPHKQIDLETRSARPGEVVVIETGGRGVVNPDHQLARCDLRFQVIGSCRFPGKRQEWLDHFNQQIPQPQCEALSSDRGDNQWFRGK